MNIVLWIVIALVILSALLYIFKTGRSKEEDRRTQEGMRHETNKKVMGPERKLHEAEKKRWEDEYYKRH
jgi:hypothetical protein